MRMKAKLLLAASVFFMLLLVVSCGEPTIFSTNVTIFRLLTESSPPSVSAECTFENSSILNDITSGKGPSLVLGYIITDSPDAPSFEQEFNTQYVRKIYNGASLFNREILSLTKDTYSYSLHQFSDQNQTQFRSPYYVATATDKLDPNFTFTLTLQADQSIEVTIPSGSYTLHTIGNLMRYNGKNFNVNAAAILADPLQYPDCTITSSPPSLHCHVYAAMNVSDGRFSNIFWSSLKYIGSLTLE